MNFPFYIARRYLVSKKSTQAINIIALISVTGISICTAALIIVLSAMNGMTDLVLSLYNSFDPDLKITPERGKTFEVTDPFKAIQKIPVVLYYSEVLQENALFKHGEKQHIGTIKGVDGNFGKMSGLDSFIVSGNFDLGSDTMPMALAGGGIAAKLDLVVNRFPHSDFHSPKRGPCSHHPGRCISYRIFISIRNFFIKRRFRLQVSDHFPGLPSKHYRC
jgi:lipoprotein-releasing system permease protein